MHWVSVNRSEQVAGKPLPTGNGSVEHPPAKAQTQKNRHDSHAAANNGRLWRCVVTMAAEAR